MLHTPAVSFRSLNDIKPGCRVRIRRHHSSGAVRQRLMDLGLMPNVDVLVVRSAPLNDPIELKLEAANVSLRRQEAATIEVFDNDEQ
ncbi:ferrous iron transport protein A [Rhodobium orientis]|uniref:Ferrous iron transport protein A n=1 Tax=Rhodobium orientis TaxID=34017 RepID=A0A327JJQ9_9HYPH|nr:FeoA family protein [Rhodobium orientis]MBB4305420.1 ferrous iron transport protein A [Rhodobium orientis]MBK5948329.1 ferrous iron transport protein A [Rhodobium orientis]RAI25503.1 ferrous iron transport protein A [Rhodobium orientis]